MHREPRRMRDVTIAKKQIRLNYYTKLLSDFYFCTKNYVRIFKNIPNILSDLKINIKYTSHPQNF